MRKKTRSERIIKAERGGVASGSVWSEGAKPERTPGAKERSAEPETAMRRSKNAEPPSGSEGVQAWERDGERPAKARKRRA